MADTQKNEVPGNVKYITGKVFTRLTVRRFAGVDKHRNALWECRCSCGKEITASRNRLVTGNTQSCGCLHREITGNIHRKHGGYLKPEYRSWNAMMNRASSPERAEIKYYEHVTVCERWRDLTAFIEDMGKRPGPCYSLDRIDGSKGYFKENCRWATQIQQQNNKSNNKRIVFRGENLTHAQWGRKLGFPKNLIRKRLVKGWSEERALTTPVQIKHRKPRDSYASGDSNYLRK